MLVGIDEMLECWNLLASNRSKRSKAPDLMKYRCSL